MSQTRNLTLGALALAGGLSSLFTLDEREVAVVTSFGAPVRTLLEPGLYFKAPWPIHEVVRYDSRTHLLDVEATELLTKDKKNLVVEAFAVWQVADPLRFLEAVGSAEAAELRLSDMIVSHIATSLGQLEFTALVSQEATSSTILPRTVRDDVANNARELLGIEVMEVRIQHLGLPLQNEQSIYERMRAERSRIANQYRSEGEEKAMGIRARADRQAAEILAESERTAAQVLAIAEEEAARVYAETYRADPELYRLLRNLDANRALLGEDTTVILDSDSDLFRALTEDGP
ncbi:MAG: protease modulator HflC [Myxococcota bacterium]|nr:protease modulator HflC [Myxococcota bacterium]